MFHMQCYKYTVQNNASDVCCGWCCSDCDTIRHYQVHQSPGLASWWSTWTDDLLPHIYRSVSPMWPGVAWWPPSTAPRHTQIPDTAMKTSLSHTTHSRYMDSFITTVIKCLKSRSITLFRLIFKLVIITLLKNNYLVSLSN